MRTAAAFILVTLVLASHAMSQDRAPFRIIAFGDSLTAPRQGVVIYSEILAGELSGKGIQAEVLNAGVPGNTSEMARARYEKDVLSRSPDLVIIMLGTNDAAVDVWKKPPATTSRVPIERYRENLQYFVRSARATGADAILVTPIRMAWTEKLRSMYGKPPYRTDDDTGFNLVLVRYTAVMREVAKAEGVTLVDAEPLVPASALLDGMHPSSEGHQILAGALVGPVVGLLRKRR